MVIPVSQIQNVLRTYGRQLNIARLNTEKKRQVIQRQEDRIEISEEAKRMLDHKPQATAPDVSTPVNKTFDEFEGEIPGTNEKLGVVNDDDFNF